MKEKIKAQGGFIQTPLLIVIIMGVLVLSSGYLGTHQYRNYQAEKVKQKEQAELNQKKEEGRQQKLQGLLDLQREDLEKQKIEIEALKNKKPEVIEETKKLELPNKNDLQTIIKYWHPVVVYVLCEFEYSNGVILYQSGSGTLCKTRHTISGNMAIKVITNNHVLSDEKNNGSNKCSVVVPFDQTYTMINDGTSEITGRDDVDLGGIVINNPSKYLQDLSLLQQEGINACRSVPDLGSPIAILGYPAIGSQTDITITQGIISAYDGNYYVTDAKIEHGNSGGAAIDINNNCYLGIPTWVEAGTIESLGRILKWQAT